MQRSMTTPFLNRHIHMDGSGERATNLCSDEYIWNDSLRSVLLFVGGSRRVACDGKAHPIPCPPNPMRTHAVPQAVGPTGYACPRGNAGYLEAVVIGVEGLRFGAGEPM